MKTPHWSTPFNGWYAIRDWSNAIFFNNPFDGEAAVDWAGQDGYKHACACEANNPVNLWDRPLNPEAY